MREGLQGRPVSAVRVHFGTMEEREKESSLEESLVVQNKSLDNLHNLLPH